MTADVSFLEGECVELAHGAGGRTMAELIDRVFKRHLDNQQLARSEDSAVFEPPAGRLAFTTDSYVISPLVFPGGDIGSLAVHGTINDLAMAGARPLHLSAGFILEEGFSLRSLDEIAQSMAAAARDAGVNVVTGDTKVVERGKGDGIFVNTAGIGLVAAGTDLDSRRLVAGDVILINGTIGDHGVAVLSMRAGLEFETALRSDSAALHDLVAAMLDAVPNLKALRDPTRGGVAATLNEIASARRLGMLLHEERLPLAEPVKGACELLGLDPLYVANEGKLLAFCDSAAAPRLLSAMQGHPLGRNAAIIGRVTDDPGLVELETSFGGRRVVDWIAGEQLPRIC